MVYISRVYTRSGDDGTTMLASGERVPKTDVRIGAYGSVDELNAWVGSIRLEGSRIEAAWSTTLDTELARIQNELFNLGAELATATPDGNKPRLAIEPRHVTALEHAIDAWNEDLPPLTSFILPGGGALGVACHHARTVCRRAERAVLVLHEHHVVRTEAREYLNRLSDYFFVLGRACSHRLNLPEALWAPETT